jgi:hypothetical protein
MSDVEHELVVENELLRAEVARLRAVARRAIDAAPRAQDDHTGSHEAWLDDALRDTARA